MRTCNDTVVLDGNRGAGREKISANFPTVWRIARKTLRKQIPPYEQKNKQPGR
jgi:hypothetical protein